MSFLIAEVKVKSPFGYVSNRPFDYLLHLAAEHGDMISIHTNLDWGGNYDLLGCARNWTNKPILAKGFHEHDEDIQRALDHGADKVLVVGRIPADKYLPYCFLEPYTLEELANYPSDCIAVWNSRYLQTGWLKDETFSDARKVFSGKIIQASNIRSPADVHDDSYAHLVGEKLETYIEGLK